MLYLEKICQAICVVCFTAIITAVIYVEVTSPVITQEMVETEKRHEVMNELIDYKRDWQDCFTLNRSINSDDMMEAEMTKCLEERGH